MSLRREPTTEVDLVNPTFRNRNGNYEVRLSRGNGWFKQVPLGQTGCGWAGRGEGGRRGGRMGGGAQQDRHTDRLRDIVKVSLQVIYILADLDSSARKLGVTTLRIN